MLKPTLSLLLLSLIAVAVNPASADEKPKPAAEEKVAEKAEQGIDEAAREKKRQLQEQQVLHTWHLSRMVMKKLVYIQLL